jgi:hypothetical protein
LGIDGYWLIRKLVHDGLISLDRCIVRSLLLTRHANIKLRSCGVSSIRRGADDIRENGYRSIQRRRDGNPQQLQFFSIQINLTNTKLPLDRFIKMWVARISFNQLEI